MKLNTIEIIFLGLSIICPVALAKNFIIPTRYNIYKIPSEKLNIKNLIILGCKGLLIAIIAFIGLRVFITDSIFVLILCTISVILVFGLLVVRSRQIGYITNHKIVLYTNDFGYSGVNDDHYFFNITGHSYKHIKCRFHGTQSDSFINSNKFFLLDITMFNPFITNQHRYVVYKIKDFIGDSFISKK